MKKKIGMTLGAVLVVLSLCACGKAASSTTEMYAVNKSAPMEAARTESADDYGFYTDEE